MLLVPIAIAHSPFKEKFGIPRQSGIASFVETRLAFLPPYRNADALRGLEGFSHLWLIWGFHANKQTNANKRPNQQKESKNPISQSSERHQPTFRSFERSEKRILADKNSWSPTVRPPRLGGNQRMGVFATRSPFRPNPIGLSSVRLLRIEDYQDGKVLVVSGADLMDGTPIYDIKPFIPYTDNHPDAVGGFTDKVEFHHLKVNFHPQVSDSLSDTDKQVLTEILQQDPRPAYKTDSNRVYGLRFGEWDIKFTVKADTLTVIEM